MRIPLDGTHDNFVQLKHRQIVALVGALLLGAIAFVSPFMPPFSILGWIVGGLPTSSFELWWYALPEPRSDLLYDVGTGVASMVYPALVATSFFLWCQPVVRLGILYPRRTEILGASFAVLSLIYFARSWSYGLEYQGLPLVLIYLGTSVTLFAVVAGIWLRFRRSSNWMLSLASHWLLFFWISVLCFPWLGEMI